MSEGRVAGRVALVTGGASGIGRAIAATLAVEGAQVCIADLDVARGTEAATEMGADFYEHDVTDEQGWKDLVAEIEREYGALHILVNAAAINAEPSDVHRPSDPENTTFEEWMRDFTVNAGGVFLGCKYAMPAMRRAGYGSIVNLSSGAALVGTPGMTAYSASKAAVSQFTQSVAVHCALKGDATRCNAVLPGIVGTPMLQRSIERTAVQLGMTVDDARTWLLRRVPQGRLGLPEEIAQAVLFLASPESSYVTGQFLVVDGGMRSMG